MNKDKIKEDFINSFDEENGGPIARMTFKKLAKEWLDSKYDESNPTSPTNISYKYYKKSLVMIDEYNDEFGDMSFFCFFDYSMCWFIKLATSNSPV